VVYLGSTNRYNSYVDMYTLTHPTPIEIDLSTAEGLDLRQQAAEWLAVHLNTTGAQRAGKNEQGYGALAEIVVRKYLGLEPIKSEDHPVGYDILLPIGVKVDVKCRGGDFPFRETYESADGIPRESKHNFFARQLLDPTLDADIFLLTHLTVSSKGELPGSSREKKWRLYVCGWVSKDRVLKEGVYLPPQSLSEQGKSSWMSYQYHQVEFYNKNLNGLSSVSVLNDVDSADVSNDAAKSISLHLTAADSIRIVQDLIGRGVLNTTHLDAIKREMGVAKTVRPILHANQYHHLLEWMRVKGYVGDDELQKLAVEFPKEPFTGISS